MTYKSKLEPHRFIVALTINASSYERALQQLSNMKKRATHVNQRIQFEEIIR